MTFLARWLEENQEVDVLDVNLDVGIELFDRAFDAGDGSGKVVRRVEHQRRGFFSFLLHRARNSLFGFETANVADQVVEIVVPEADVEKGFHRGAGPSQHDHPLDHMVGCRGQKSRVGDRRGEEIVLIIRELHILKRLF